MTMQTRTEDVFDYLKRCAAEMRTATYEEIAHAVGIAPIGIGHQLGYIRDQVCRARGLPWLTAIAVSTATRRPSHSFLPEGVSFGEDQEFLWRGMVLQVLAYDWDHVNFNG